MKKFLMLFLCAAVLCVECAACDFSKPKTVTVTNGSGEVITSLAPDTNEAEVSTERSTERYEDPGFTLSQKEIKNADKSFRKLIASLKAYKFKSIKIRFTAGDLQVKYYESTDKKVIQQWISLLKKTKTSVTERRDYIGGSTYEIVFCKPNGEEVCVGNLYDPYIYNYNNGVDNAAINIIENYDELKNDFDAALNAVIKDENRINRDAFKNSLENLK